MRIDQITPMPNFSNALRLRQMRLANTKRILVAYPIGNIGIRNYKKAPSCVKIFRTSIEILPGACRTKLRGAEFLANSMRCRIFISISPYPYAPRSATKRTSFSNGTPVQAKRGSSPNRSMYRSLNATEFKFESKMLMPWSALSSTVRKTAACSVSRRFNWTTE